MENTNTAEFSPVKTAGAIASGALVGFLLVAANGLFALQRYGSQLGAVMDPWSNSVAAATDPHGSPFAVAGAAALGALAIGSILLPRAKRSFTTTYAWSLVASGVVSVSIGVVLASHLGLQYELEAGDGPSAGIRGWLEYGSAEPAVYVVLFTATAVALLGHAQSEKRPAETGPLSDLS
ncbi:hypothetical protein [Leucobacter aridicollis]|uniref:hypothetical protein n=1 Tax=Leucobacter aridicollis TaxID=283878 RepID=UPI002104AF7D|nr:hypothetical protein [Leucobacter aridicollis]UTX53802.1 hypothetical protein KI794_03455 [Leucobacter aridicollis]